MADGEVGHFVTIDDHPVFIAESAGSVPARLKTEGSAKARFNKSSLQKALIDHHNSVTDGGSYTHAHEKALAEAAGAGNPFTFYKKLPTEIKEFQQGRPELRSMFKVTDKKSEAGGADAFGELGDKYLHIAEAKAGSPLKAALKTAHGSNDPEVKFLAAIHDNLPAASERPDQQLISADKLRLGEKFKINGSEFIVAEDQHGMRVLEGGSDYPTTPVDALGKIPVDKGSFKPKAGPKREAIPFSADDYVLAGVGLSDPESIDTPVGHPTEIDGQPCHYFRKEIARVGKWTHPTKRDPQTGQPFRFTIDTKRMDRWVSNHNRYKSNGHLPFVPDTHVETKAEASKNHGFVFDVQREDDSLYSIMQIIGDESAKATAKNDVSIYIKSGIVDSVDGYEYDELLEHVALTPRPGLVRMKPFERIAASGDSEPREVPVLVLSSDPVFGAKTMSLPVALVAEARTMLGFAKEIELDDEKLVRSLMEKLTNGTTELAAKGQEVVALSADVTTKKAKVTELETTLATVTSERDAKKAEVLSLSADIPDAKSAGMYATNMNIARENAIKAGIPASAMEPFDKMIKGADGKPVPLALSACGESRNPMGYELMTALESLAKATKMGGAIIVDGGVERPAGVTAAAALALSADTGKPYDDMAAAAQAAAKSTISALYGKPAKKAS